MDGRKSYGTHGNIWKNIWGMYEYLGILENGSILERWKRWEHEEVKPPAMHIFSTQV